MTEQKIKLIEKTFGMKRILHLSDHLIRNGFTLENYFLFESKNQEYSSDFIEISTNAGRETVQLEFGRQETQDSINAIKKLIEILEDK